MHTTLIRQTARWMLFSALAFAPWFYGSTTALGIKIVDWLLASALLFWAIELVISRRMPQVHPALPVLAAALLFLGGWMVTNAGAIYDSDYGLFAPVRQIAAQLPGSVDYAVSAAWMIRGALLLGVVLFVADHSRSDRALLHLWYAFGVIGGSISLLGLLEKATGAKTIFWGAPLEQYGSTFFASYYYHANAGAFLNLVLPLTAGLALRSFLSRSTSFTRALWSTLFVLILVAVAANTSRGGHVIGAFTLIALVVVLGPLIVRQLTRSEINIALAGVAAVLFLLFAVAGASHLEIAQRRWETGFSHDISEDGRVQVAQVAIEALPRAGLFGFGPGSFRIVFPLINAQASHRVPGFWRFLHQDYLQTVLEWGWAGTAGWAALIFGGIATAIKSALAQRRLRRRLSEQRDDAVLPNEQKPGCRQASQWTPRRRLIVPLTVIALVGVLLHAIFDFPLQIYSIQAYVATYLGICWGCAR